MRWVKVRDGMGAQPSRKQCPKMLAPEMQWLHGSAEQEEHGGQDLSCSGFTHLAGSKKRLSSGAQPYPLHLHTGLGNTECEQGRTLPSQAQTPSQLRPGSALSLGHPLGFGCATRAQRALTIAGAPQDSLTELGFSPRSHSQP